VLTAGFSGRSNRPPTHRRGGASGNFARSSPSGPGAELNAYKSRGHYSGVLAAKGRPAHRSPIAGPAFPASARAQAGHRTLRHQWSGFDEARVVTELTDPQLPTILAGLSIIAAPAPRSAPNIVRRADLPPQTRRAAPLDTSPSQGIHPPTRTRDGCLYRGSAEMIEYGCWKAQAAPPRMCGAPFPPSRGQVYALSWSDPGGYNQHPQWFGRNRPYHGDRGVPLDRAGACYMSGTTANFFRTHSHIASKGR